MAELDLRTEKQKERDKIHDRILKAYASCGEVARPYSVFRELGRQFNMTTQAIASICRKGGLYAPADR